MNSVILCEETTDYTLLQYYMRKVNGWMDRKDIQKDVFKIEGQKSRVFLKKDSFMTIAATGGCSMMHFGLENAIKRNYFAPPDDQKQKFDAIVMITDRDEITTETEFIEKIKKVLAEKEVSHSELCNNKWINCKMINS